MHTLLLMEHHIHTSVPLAPRTAAAILEDPSLGLMTRCLHPEAPLLRGLVLECTPLVPALFCSEILPFSKAEY